MTSPIRDGTGAGPGGISEEWRNLILRVAVAEEETSSIRAKNQELASQAKFLQEQNEMQARQITQLKQAYNEEEKRLAEIARCRTTCQPHPVSVPHPNPINSTDPLFTRICRGFSAFFSGLYLSICNFFSSLLQRRP